MTKIKWITRKEVVRAADTSLLAAVRYSKKHWWQLYIATPRQIIGGLRSNKVNLGPHYCALCKCYDECNSHDECPLSDLGADVCCNEYAIANSLLLNDDASLRNDIEWVAFKKAAKQMHRRICEVEKEILEQPE